MFDAVLRPVRESDLDSLLSCVSESSYGLTSLPKDKSLLKGKIEHSIKSFSSHVERPGCENYLFVLESLDNKELIGTCGIVSTTGMEKPFYSFKIQRLQHACPSLKIFKEHTLLHLTEIRKGPSEICALFLKPAYRKHGLSKLLSLSRFHFMNTFRTRFHETIVAEMRGVIDSMGYSPFYEFVCKPFFDMSFPEACIQRSLDESFIYDLMPKEPIYVNILPKEAQEVIGKTHPNTLPALNLLLKEGFFAYGEIDIFDAGPDIYGSLADLQTIKTSKRAKVIRSQKEINSADSYLLCNQKLDFRACYVKLFEENGSIVIEERAREALQIDQNEVVSYS